MLKRAFDVIASGIGLIVLSPVLLALALAVRLGSPGPIFYKAARVGRGVWTCSAGHGKGIARGRRGTGV